jgi:hypothetical protein
LPFSSAPTFETNAAFADTPFKYASAGFSGLTSSLFFNEF